MKTRLHCIWPCLYDLGKPGCPGCPRRISSRVYMISVHRDVVNKTQTNFVRINSIPTNVVYFCFLFGRFSLVRRRFKFHFTSSRCTGMLRLYGKKSGCPGVLVHRIHINVTAKITVNYLQAEILVHRDVPVHWDHINRPLVWIKKKPNSWSKKSRREKRFERNRIENDEKTTNYNRSIWLETCKLKDHEKYKNILPQNVTNYIKNYKPNIAQFTVNG